MHVHFGELPDLDGGSVLQDKWIADYRARWAAARAAASVGPGDGGAWLDGDAARVIMCDAMAVPVVIGDVDPGAVERLITLCVEYDRVRTRAAARPGGVGSGDGPGDWAAQPAEKPVPASRMPPLPRPPQATVPRSSLAPAAEAEPAAGTAEVLAMLEHKSLTGVNTRD